MITAMDLTSELTMLRTLDGPSRLLLVQLDPRWWLTTDQRDLYDVERCLEAALLDPLARLSHVYRVVPENIRAVASESAAAARHWDWCQHVAMLGAVVEPRIHYSVRRLMDPPVASQDLVLSTCLEGGSPLDDLLADYQRMAGTPLTRFDFSFEADKRDTEPTISI
jgi:hypothetical protein